ncbi:MAG: DUF6178 family protein, partial [Myxococcota bacterium]
MNQPKSAPHGLQLPDRTVIPTDPEVIERLEQREHAGISDLEWEELLDELSLEEQQAITRLRQDVMRVSGTQKLRMILNAPSPRVLVRAMPPQELLHNIKSIGLEDCAEIVALTGKEQLTYALDLDCWRKDKFDTEQYSQWLQFLISKDVDAAEQVLKAVDIETLIVYFQQCFVIRNQSEEGEDVPEEIEGEVISSQFHNYHVILPFEPEDSMLPLAREALNLFELYGYKFYHRLFEAIRWSLPSELQEIAYQFHKNRIEDMGFVDYYDAISIYQPLPTSTAPFPVAEAQPVESIPVSTQQHVEHQLRELLRDIDASHHSRMYTEIIHLSHKMISADQLDPSDPKMHQNVLRFLYQMIQLGIEQTCGKDAKAAQNLLEHTHLEWIFRTGFSLLLQLKKQAAKLKAHPQLQGPGESKSSATLLPASFRRFLDILDTPKPKFFLAASNPKQQATRPFRKVQDIHEAQHILDMIAMLPHLFFEQLGLVYEQLPALFEQSRYPSHHDVDLFVLFATAWAQQLLQEEFVCQPLHTEQLVPFLEKIFHTQEPP